MSAVKIDPRLKEWATPRQAEYIDAVNSTSYTRAAKDFKVCLKTIQGSITGLKKRAAKHGYAPEHDMTKTVPEPFLVKGTSTLYDEDGKARLQWVKTTLDQEKVEQAIRDAVDALAQEVVRLPPLPAPKSTEAQLVNLYTLTDCHVGMRSWAQETGEDWDLEIAERTLTGAFQHMIGAAPPAEVGFVNQLGDFLHYDGLAPITPTGGHLLDADGRYPKVVKVAVRILRAMIDSALARHKKVVVLMAEGNHDIAGSVWLRHLFSLLYENEPRVEVMETSMAYYAYQHGKTMLAFHHGHLSKTGALPLLFAAQYPQVWGATTRRYCHTGHRHHVEEKEHSGMIVIQHPTIAARDAYAARGGWVADRSMTAITYHSKHGQVGRTTVVPEMLL